MTRLSHLQQKIADEAARSDIESLCTPIIQCYGSAASWYSIISPDFQATVDIAVEYLTLRGRIARHPVHAYWVRVDIENFELEAA